MNKYNEEIKKLHSEIFTLEYIASKMFKEDEVKNAGYVKELKGAIDHLTKLCEYTERKKQNDYDNRRSDF